MVEFYLFDKMAQNLWVCRQTCDGGAESYGNSIFNLQRNLNTAFYRDHTKLRPCQQCIRVSLSPHLCQDVCW